MMWIVCVDRAREHVEAGSSGVPAAVGGTAADADAVAAGRRLVGYALDGDDLTAQFFFCVVSVYQLALPSLV